MAEGKTGSELTGFGREVDAEGCDAVFCWVPVELTDKEVIVLHAQGELLYICRGWNRLVQGAPASRLLSHVPGRFSGP